GEKGVPYFSLINNGIRFHEYVGVIQIGDTVVEVLPKADSSFTSGNEKKEWRDVLIDMLLSVGIFDVYAPSSSSLRLKSNSILDLYFELFLKETEYLLHNGLVKKYRNKEGNSSALKGSLQFQKQIQKNLTNAANFYVKYTVYDTEHHLHSILYKTLKLLKQMNTSPALSGRIGSLLLNFPEMPDLNVNEKTFSRIVYDRKTKAYRKALEIARLLLLQYHPDLSSGRDNVLALMFDMNVLWERFVFVSLRNGLDEKFSVTAQKSKPFWKPEGGYFSSIRPDILIHKKNENKCIVLDTKWKILLSSNPSPEDLRQMSVYMEYFDAVKSALVYPGKESDVIGMFYGTGLGSEEKECSVLQFSVPEKNPETNLIRTWQKEICRKVSEWAVGKP
ncbi:MAG TPA: hypothetical protein PKK05_23860, partial [Leptospiraceae bacterium]|nr:hypothetical protein [Leptospiraceae bacterium]